MLKSNHQRVGALAGLLLFFGTWLSVFYNHWFWAVVTIVSVLTAFWVALEDESSEDLGERAKKGFAVGVLAAIVARLMGVLMMVWVFDSWVVQTSGNYEAVSDMFRVIVNGNITQSLLFILGTGIIGAFIAYAVPYFTTEMEEE